MTRRDVIVPAIMLLREGTFYLPHLKNEILSFTLSNADLVFKHTFKDKVDEETNEQIQEQIKLEMVITAVHCAEVLGSYLLAFEKGGKAIQRTLFDYKVSDIKIFYRNIRKRRASSISKLFSYPQPYQLNSSQAKEKFKASCNKIKNELIEIGEYYLNNLDLYNSYKHGLRVGCLFGGEPGSKESKAAIGYFVPDESFYPAQGVITRIDHRKPKKLVSVMVSLLRIAADNFLNRVMSEEESFRLRTY